MSVSATLAPWLPLLAGAVLLPWSRNRWRAALLLGLPAWSLWLVWQVPDGPVLEAAFLGHTLTPVQGDALSRLFGTAFALLTGLGALYALDRARTAELVAAFLYAGSALGAVFAGDLLTLFLFWETMALSSALLVWSGGGADAGAAGLRYLMIHLLAGVLLMAGIAGHVATTGSLAFTALTLDGAPALLILAAFLINAGAPPLSSWVADAYPEASPAGMVFLSAFTTKTAVYVLWRGFAGTELLVPVGLAMVLYGLLYALLENDLRRMLAYGIVNQVGFMLVGIGIGSEAVLNGVAALAVIHILYKALLLMSAGVVLQGTGQRHCTGLGGLYRSMPFATGLALVAVCTGAALPLTAGFAAKPLLLGGTLAAGFTGAWYLLLGAAAVAFLHAGLNYLWFVFFAGDRGLRPPDARGTQRIAMLALALLCVGIGVFPGVLYAHLPFPVSAQPYTATHVLHALQLLLGAGLAFTWLLPYLERRQVLVLDFDWIYRRLGPRLYGGALRFGDRLHERLSTVWRRGLRRLISLIIRHHGPRGILARGWPTGSTVLWVAVLLVGYLFFHYL